MRIRSAVTRASLAMASEPLEGTQRRVRLDRSSEWVDVVRLGESGRDPIVLIPGLAGGWRLLAPFARQLSKRHDVIICGLRGDKFPQGGGTPAEMGDYANDFAEIFGKLGLERPTVMGVSFGGAIALELAVTHPSKLGALVLYGAEAQFRATLASTIARRVLERFPLPSDSDFVNQFFNLLHGSKPEPGALPEFVVQRCWETDQCVMARRIALLESFDVSDRLWRIDVPTLVLAGTRDVVVPSARQRLLAQSISGARFETIQGAGHIGFLTHRRELVQPISKLLRQVKHSSC